MATLPLKAAILKYAVDHKDEILSADSIMEGMKDSVYASESQFSKARVTAYIDAFGQCGFFKKENIEITESGDVEVSYRLTETGLNRAKRFVPGCK